MITRRVWTTPFVPHYVPPLDDMQKKEDLVISTVEDTFEISKRGIVLVPGLKKRKLKVSVGDEILLYRPDGSVLETSIAGVEMIKYHTKPKEHNFPILLPKGIKREDVPVGTRIYLKADLHPSKPEHIQSDRDNG